MAEYTRAWFAGQAEASASSARVVVPLIVDLVKPRSAVDVGCGEGGWAAEFRNTGVPDVVGIDGEYVDRSALKIPAETFTPKDLSSVARLGAAFGLGRRFDVALSVEVAEHLPASAAGAFVTALTELAPIVVFGAAIPGQGGTEHVNEQPQSSWAKLFAQRGYLAADVLRPRVWDDARVSWWYRQNTIVYVGPEHASREPWAAAIERTKHALLDAVHPELFAGVHRRSAKPVRSALQDARAWAQERKLLP